MRFKKGFGFRYGDGGMFCAVGRARRLNELRKKILVDPSAVALRLGGRGRQKKPKPLRTKAHFGKTRFR